MCDLGVIPTPSIARAVLQMQADFGISVTASHNPASDNGIKLFDKNACKLDQGIEGQIEALTGINPVEATLGVLRDIGLPVGSP